MVERILQAWYGQTWNTVVAMDCSAERASALRGQRLHWLFRWVQYSTGVRTSVCKWENSNKCFHKTAAARPCFAQWRAPSRGAPLRGARPSAFRRQTPWSIIRPTPPGPLRRRLSKPSGERIPSCLFLNDPFLAKRPAGALPLAGTAAGVGACPCWIIATKQGEWADRRKTASHAWRASAHRAHPPSLPGRPARPAPRQLPAARAAWYAPPASSSRRGALPRSLPT